MSYEQLESQIIRHESEELRPYLDSVGKWTVGVGRNISDVHFSDVELLLLIGDGISEDLSRSMLASDLGQAEEDVSRLFTNVEISRMGGVRHECIINMSFNLGLTRLKQFKKMIAAVRVQDWDEAGAQMMDSRWYRQVGNRGVELVAQMRTGEYQS